MRPDWKMHTRQNGTPVSLDRGGNWNHVVGGREKKQYPKEPPQRALEKLKEKGKVRGINSLLGQHCVKKQSHLKDTKYEMQRKHFESSNISQMLIFLLFLRLNVKHNRKCVKMHVIPLRSITPISSCYPLNTVGSLSNSKWDVCVRMKVQYSKLQQKLCYNSCNNYIRNTHFPLRSAFECTKIISKKQFPTRDNCKAYMKQKRAHWTEDWGLRIEHLFNCNYFWDSTCIASL